MLGIPHVYDMHSSLPQQLSNFAYSRSRVLRWMFRAVRAGSVRHSKVVIVICPELRRIVQELQPGAEPILIENAPGADDGPAAGAGGAARAAFGIAPATPLVVYTGTFEAYQGLDLLFAAAALVQVPPRRAVPARRRPSRADRRGARPGSGRGYRRRGHLHRRAARSARSPASSHAADVLVSPRSRGTNTPLKIYQYLRSGRAIVATRLLTHTQVLDDSVAILTGVSPREFADGILAALADPAMAAARRRPRRASSRPRSTATTPISSGRARCVARVTSAPRPQVAGGLA